LLPNKNALQSFSCLTSPAEPISRRKNQGTGKNILGSQIAANYSTGLAARRRTRCKIFVRQQSTLKTASIHAGPTHFAKLVLRT
jgi:hypothetical protein